MRARQGKDETGSEVIKNRVPAVKILPDD